MGGEVVCSLDQKNSPEVGIVMLMMQSLSETTAIRLFNSVAATAQNSGTLVLTPHMSTTPEQVEENASFASVHSGNESRNSCRICRWNRSDMQILSCPCHCKGSVGFVHLQCLKRWILHRRDGRCEICNTPFNMPQERVKMSRMIKSFMGTKCLGRILKHLLFSASLLPLANVVLQQVLITMENLNSNNSDQVAIHELIIASCALLTSSALFFHFFEYITTRFFIIRNICRQWWYFGNTSEFSLVQISTDSI